MGQQTTITVEEQTLERFKQLKRELNRAQEAPDHTADTFLQALMDTWDAADDGFYDAETEELVEQLKNEISMANDPAVEVDTEELISRVDELQETVKENTQALQSVERTVENLGQQ